MRLPRTVLALLAGISIASHAAAHGGERHDFKIVNGRWFDGHGFVPRTVYTVGGVFRDAWDGKVEATLDLHGANVGPPFADAHNHAFGSVENFEGELRRFLIDGVFYVKNPNDPPALSAAAAAKLSKPATLDIVYSHGGLTATGGHPVQVYEAAAGQGAFRDWAKDRMAGQAYYLVDDAAALEREWPRLLATKPDFVKVYLEHSEEYAKRRDDPAFFGKKGLDPALLTAIVAKARAARLRVSAHIATAADFRVALAAGVDEITHLPLERLTPEDARRAAEAKTVVVTTTLSHRDTHGIADLDGIHRDNLRLLRNAGVRLAIGLDSHGTVVIEAENIHRLAPFDDATLLSIWTADTARAIFPERRIGCLAEGCEASFLALTGDPLADFGAIRKISLRMKQGFVINVVPSIAEPIRRTLQEKGAAAASAEYRRLRTEKPDGYEFAEAELNRLGYELLKTGKPADAIAILRVNTEAFPASPNAQDSLREACESSGDRECAIAAAKKTLELLASDTKLPAGFRQSLEQNARKTLEGEAKH
jgi:hypothetical protein